MSDDLIDLGLDADEPQIQVTVETGVCTPKDIWENKNKWYEETQKSREEWDKLEDDKREAMIGLVKNAIARMYDRVGEWVPESFVFESGNFVGCQFKILCTDIDKEIERAEAATSFQIAEATKETVEMLSEFDDDGEAVVREETEVEFLRRRVAELEAAL